MADTNLDDFLAIMRLAKIKVLDYWELPDGYSTTRGLPWYLFKTPYGLIKMGWRKRVISIDWSDTGIRYIITSDDVTKDVNYVHAWSNAKAVEYLNNLRLFIGDGGKV